MWASASHHINPLLSCTGAHHHRRSTVPRSWDVTLNNPSTHQCRFSVLKRWCGPYPCTFARAQSIKKCRAKHSQNLEGPFFHVVIGRTDLVHPRVILWEESQGAAQGLGLHAHPPHHNQDTLRLWWLRVARVIMWLESADVDLDVHLATQTQRVAKQH